MKIKIILIISVLSCSVITVYAQTTSDDFFPLAVGNSWTYNYSGSDYDQLGDYVFSDTGLATYRIVSQSLSTDSIIWNIQEVRNIVRHYYTTMPPLIDTTYNIIDSTTFPVIEYRKDNHRLVSWSSNWESVFYFRPEFADSNAFPRYNPSQAEDTFTVTLAQYFNQGEIAQVYKASLQRHIGMTMVTYSAPGVTGWVPNTYHTLKSSFITSVESGKQSVLPKDFVLHQNYPNPFNPSTTIYFDNPTNSKIKISIYDALGRLTETILNDDIQPGKHSIQWNALHYSSGVYFCVAQMKNQTKSIRLVLIK